ncbi:hypothetical protein K3495_g3544 [Podosphaera aphanis]|nr:hypothetical protein K3495_g3544 [Podosphaera aphanis]
MSEQVLVDHDINTSRPSPTTTASPLDWKPEPKGMDYHRQMFQAKMDESKGQQTYISPSDTIMSPCTAKLSAYRNTQVGKAKPKSLFPKTAAKSPASMGSLFGAEIPSMENAENTKAAEEIKVDEGQ